MQIKFPDNQPTTLPVYKVIDFVVLYDDIDETDRYKGPQVQDSVRDWFKKLLKDRYDLPLPEVNFEPQYFGISNEDKQLLGFLQMYQYIDGMELYSSSIDVGTTDLSYNFGYHVYKLETVGEIKIQSAQEAYEQIESGNDISVLSRKPPNESTQHYTHTGWQKAAYNTVKLSWYYPPAAEHDWPHTGEYLIPIWEFRVMFPDGESHFPCMINAVDGNTTIAWSPEGNPKFTPNEKFYELKDIKTRKWIQDPAHKDQNTPRNANIHADETVHVDDKIQNGAQRLRVPFIS